MHQQHPEYDAMITQQRYDDILREMAEARLAAMVPPQPSLLRQAAKGIGQGLIWLGTLLSRYGHTNRNEQTLIEI